MTADQALTAEEESCCAAVAQWAEEDMTLPVDSSTALRGHDAAAHGRAVLEEALGGPEQVKQEIQGAGHSGIASPQATVSGTWS